MERAILARLTHLIPRPHQHSFAFCKGMGTAENLSYIHSVIDGNDSIIVFLDLEKAFELANAEAILSLLAKRGVAGNILAWTKDYHHERQARIRYQGHFSEFLTFENGTPQGGILSPFLFNILIADLLTIHLPSDILAYADADCYRKKSIHSRSSRIGLTGT